MSGANLLGLASLILCQDKKAALLRICMIFDGEGDGGGAIALLGGAVDGPWADDWLFAVFLFGEF